MKIRRKMIALLLTALLAAGMLPVQALAAGGYFYLSAVGNGAVIIAPERVTYAAGQTLGQALEASGHDFAGLETGMVTTIDGVVGNFTRSDQNGGYALDQAASQVTHFCFSDAGSSQPSQAMQALMTAMGDYKLEDADVRQAAKPAYDKAYAQLPGISDATASSCALALTNAVEAYKENQNGVKYTVTFSGCRNMDLEAVNEYGKTFTDTGRSGQLALPAGSYTFLVRDGSRRVSGQVTVTADQTVPVTMPQGDWLKLDTLALSANYGEEDFLANTFPAETEDSRTVRATVPDRFTGAVYVYADYDTTLSYSSVPTLTALYTDAAGTAREEKQAFGSYRTGAPQALAAGAAGNTLTLRMSAQDGDGHMASQDYTVRLERTPTLRSLAVKDQSGVSQTAQQHFDGAATDYTYRVLSTVTSVTILPEAFDPSYSVLVNGQSLPENGAVIPVQGETAVTVTVSGSGFTTTYQLTIVPGAGRRITFNTTAADITLRVVNRNGDELAFTRERNAEGYNAYQYTLVPGETYTYIASQSGKYFASKDFTLEESANSVITVKVKAQDWLESLQLGTGTGSPDTIALEQTFDPATHSYTASLPDTDAAVYTWVTAAQGVDVTASYEQLHYSRTYDGVTRQVALTSGAKLGKVLTRVLLAKNGHGNQVTYRLSQTDPEDGVTYYQDYTVQLNHTFTLEALTAQLGGKSAPLYRSDESQGYDKLETAYKVTVPAAATELTLLAQVHPAANNYRYGETGPGYHVSRNGEDFTEAGQVMVALNGSHTPETVELVLTNDYVPEAQTVYTIQVEKAAPITASIAVEPQDALLTLHDTASGNRLWPENGVYLLSDGYSYRYTLTKTGYVGKTGLLETAKDESGNSIILLDGQTVTPAVVDGKMNVSLTLKLDQAPVNDSLNPDLPSQWPDFRGNDDNNGVTDAPVPANAEKGTLYWANQLGKGFDTGAVGCPILVNGCLITYSSNTIYRVDSVSGQVLARGTMDHSSSFSITPPVYADGMVFVALSDGTVQAFNAETLESLWVYRDPLGGQPNSPLTVYDGYLYTGFWNAENSDANYVCLSITDEDPSNPKEEKLAAWYHTQLGGFYWAGAYVCGDYMLVGTDDGFGGYNHQTSQLLLLNPKTGQVLDSWDGLDADIRSTIARDESTGKFYFTSKGGSFYSVTVERDGSSWRIDGKRRLKLQNGSSSYPAMSTSTPVVYNGRAYVGVAGVGQFTQYSGHNITVIDLASGNIAYRVPTQGYPQTSGLLTTAYEAETGSVYVYFFDNYTPGKLRALQDKAGQTEPVLLTVENGQTTPYVLFTPTGAQAEYAICSPIVDEYGTIYFKNDSANLMAYGSAIVRLTVEQEPDKMEYNAGESFDPTGMQVVAHYANGKSRDVTAYVTWPQAALEEGQTTLTLSFPYVMYHNAPGDGGEMKTGVPTSTPAVDLPITVGGAVTPATGIEKAERSETGVTVTLNGAPQTGWKLIAASYDENGRQLSVAMADAAQTQTLPLDKPGKTVRVFLMEQTQDGNFHPVDRAAVN